MPVPDRPGGAILPLMGKQPPREGWSDSPSEVRITVVQDPRDRGLWSRLRVRRGDGRVPRRAYGVGLVAAAVTAAVAAIVFTGSVGGGAIGVHGLNARRDQGGATSVAEAYGYPTRCLRVTIASSDHAFARADFDHGSPCGRYTGDPTAIFHVVDGAWRPVLEAVTYPCPAEGIPAAVQRELEVCPSLARSRRTR
jgi:hypothetical protein